MAFWAARGGRKDAFPGADGSTITQATPPNINATATPIYGANGDILEEESTGVIKVEITTDGIVGKDNTSLMYATKNPLTFIYNSVIPRDWYTDTEMYQNNALWANNVKTNYDPCPKGWRVPKDSELTYGDFFAETFLYYIQGNQTSLESYNATNGRLYNQTSWFPTAGARRYLSGSLGYVGRNSSYWSTSINGISVKSLDFDISAIHLSYPLNRAAGLSVRCVQE